MTDASLLPLLRAVTADPDAEAPRLAYAAAVEQAGDDQRARFIRLQCEAVARMKANREDWHVPNVEADGILKTHGAGWASTIQGRVEWFLYYRGFVEEVCVDARYFLEHGEELFQLAPIRRLTLKGVQPVLSRLLESPLLDQIVSLVLDMQRIGDAGLRELANSSHLRKLKFLDLCGNNITLDGVEALAASSALPSLMNVRFSGNPAEVIGEVVSNDALNPIVVFASGSEEAKRLEGRYGRKTWLHPVEDRGFRIPHDAEY